MTRAARLRLLAALALAALAFGLYAGTLDSPFFFDDTPSIEENPNLEHLWPLSVALGAPPGAGSSGRPLVSLSLAVNHALGGREVLGYHLFNIATLALGALALAGLVRRTLLRTDLAPHAGGLALATALVWVVHPLHTDTLNHVIYRNGSMMALFYLSALLAAARGAEPGAGRGWSVLAVASAAAAMASKEVAVSLPLVALAFDRQFHAGSVPEALRRRPGMYAGLAATWGLLAWCVWSGDRGESVGFAHTEVIDAQDSLRTQMVALWTYLRLTVLGGPLVFDYHGQEVVRSWTEVWPQALLFAGLLALGLVGTWRRSAAGLLVLTTLAILAPTSSVIPLAGELIGEHRMYLPLAPLAALAVAGTWSLLPAGGRRLGPLLVLLVVAPLAAATVRRNADYASRVTLWEDTTRKRPDNERAWNHLGLALKNEGRTDEALVAFRRTLELDPDHAKARFNLAGALFARGDRRDAALEFERAARDARGTEDEAVIAFNAGYALCEVGEVGRGLPFYRRALELRPGWERPAYLLSWTLATTVEDGLRDAAEALRLATALDAASGGRQPRHKDALAAALAAAGRYPEAEAAAERGIELARAAGRADLAAELEGRRALYAARRPYRESR
jgi:Tfp pilus assembly protein PilF